MEMTILDKIIERKKEEVRQDRADRPLALLEQMPHFGRTCHSLMESFRAAGSGRDGGNGSGRNGIIAEFKRASPSRGLINGHSPVGETVRGYQDAGAAAVSVLTDRDFFGGSLQDLLAARKVLDIPLLRKDFIIDPYQIAEAKAYGADMILLIAAALEPALLHSLSEYAKSLGLNVLMEVHGWPELEPNLIDTVDAIGVNNRNLHDFSVSIRHSLDLSGRIPDRYIKVSESGIDHPDTIRELKTAGFEGFLMGEHFMKQQDPVQSIRQFAGQL